MAKGYPPYSETPVPGGGRDERASGRSLFEVRQEKGISQEALAETADLHRTYISFLERLKRNQA